MKQYYSIGEVEKITGFSIATIRYYADQGVIVPDYVDDDSNYRYYTFDSIRKFEVVSALKMTGLSLKQIVALLNEENEEDQYQMLLKKQEQLQVQMKTMQERLNMLDQLMAYQEMKEQNHLRIYQRNIPSRLVALVDASKMMSPDEMQEYTYRTIKGAQIGNKRHGKGYLINEGYFLQNKALGLDGEFFICDDQEVLKYTESYMIPKGDYICMQTAIFLDDRWIRALTRFFSERDIRPRTILAVLKYPAVFNWKASVYEVQILI